MYVYNEVMKRTIAIACVLLIPCLSLAQTDSAGFVQGLWYDRETVFVDEPVRIYVAVRNNTGAELAGTVTFYIDDQVLTRKSVAALDGRIVESWADWTPDYGEHTVRAELSRLELSRVDGSEERTTVTASLADDILFVDYDTDGDGIGNETDTDDDGDGLTDDEERARGTDPLTYNTPEPAPTNETGNLATTTLTATSSSTTSTAQGLERFLTPSRAETLLRNITNWSNTTKRRLDNYRANRDLTIATQQADPDVPVNEDGFGAVIRSDTQPSPPEKPPGFFGDVFTFVENIVRGIYTAILTITSWLLSYPILIQVGLLVFLLFGTLRLAARLSRRP